MSNTNVTQLATNGNCIPVDALRGDGRENFFAGTTRKLNQFLGAGIKRAIVAHQLIYWMTNNANGESRSHLGEGRVAKADGELAEECMVTIYIVRQTRQLLESMGIIETDVRKWNGVPMMHYALNHDVFCAWWRLFEESPPTWEEVRAQLESIDAKDGVKVADSIGLIGLAKKALQRSRVDYGKMHSPKTETTNKTTRTPQPPSPTPEATKAEQAGGGGTPSAESNSATLDAPRRDIAAYERRVDDDPPDKPQEPNRMERDDMNPDINDRYWREQGLEEVDEADRMDPLYEFAPEFERRTGKRIRPNDSRQGRDIRGIVLFHTRDTLLELMDDAGRPSIKYPWTFFCSQLEKRAKKVKKRRSSTPKRRKRRELDDDAMAAFKASVAETCELAQGGTDGQ